MARKMFAEESDPAAQRLKARELVRLGCQEDPVSGCWLWQGSKDREGYGIFRSNSGMYRAHRISYMAFIGGVRVGDIVARDRSVCTDNGCVNPAHLRLSTLSAECRKIGKGRRSLLSEEFKDKVRSCYKSGRRQVEVAKEFGISQAQVSRICRREESEELDVVEL